MSSDERVVLAELARLSNEWRIYRDVINRAINLLNHEVLAFATRLDKDDAQRTQRQKELDAKLAAIHRWQWIRIGAEAGMLIIICWLVLR